MVDRDGYLRTMMVQGETTLKLCESAKLRLQCWAESDDTVGAAKQIRLVMAGSCWYFADSQWWPA